MVEYHDNGYEEHDNIHHFHHMVFPQVTGNWEAL